MNLKNQYRQSIKNSKIKQQYKSDSEQQQYIKTAWKIIKRLSIPI